MTNLKKEIYNKEKLLSLKTQVEKFLITDESSWVTGQIIAVDGGRSKLS